jgi:hypothetical protein
LKDHGCCRGQCGFRGLRRFVDEKVALFELQRLPALRCRLGWHLRARSKRLLDFGEVDIGVIEAGRIALSVIGTSRGQVLEGLQGSISLRVLASLPSYGPIEGALSWLRYRPH